MMNANVLLKVTALSLTLLGTALGTPLRILPGAEANEVVLESDAVLRYRYDTTTGALILVDTEAGQGLTLPAGVLVEQRGKNTYLYLPASTQFGLLADGRRLRLTVPPAAVPANPGAVANLPAQTGPAQPPATGPEAVLATAPTLGPVIPRVIFLENAQPKAVADLLTKFFPRAQIDIDARQHAVVVSATGELQLAIENTVRALDEARPQVMFEAEILEVNRDATQSLGIDYDDIFTFKFLEGTPVGPFKLGTINRATGLSLNVGINALKNSGAARVLAQPRITTMDGVEAVINSTQSTPVVITGTQGGSIQTITTGISLRLTPRVTPAGFIEAELIISVSSPTGSTSTGVPQFSSREARTTVRVRNGEPIAIGGLIEERQVTSVQKVPLLGDIPLIGELFTTTRTEDRHSDLVIIVTPRLVLPAEK